MSAHLEESRVERSQLQSALFLGKLIIPFNCGMSILAESLDSSHMYINHELLAFAIIEFKKNNNAPLNSTLMYCNRSIDT